MRQLIPILLLSATLAGIFIPVTASLSSKNTVTLDVSIAYALDGNGGGDTSPTGTGTSGSGQNTQQQDDEDPAAPYLYNCGIAGNNPIGGCIERITYFIPYRIGGWFLSKAAEFLDWTAAFTLSSTLYTASPFITDGWRITRDFANMFFIFILLYIAVSLILGLSIGGVNPKKMLASLIAIALIINFSLFITEVVIDTSNTLALVFYNQITTSGNEQGQQTLNEAAGTYASVQKAAPQLDVVPKPISVAIAEGMKPQVLQSKEFFFKLAQNAGTRGVKGADGGDVIDAGILISIYLMVGIMYFIAAYAFFVTSIAFIGRLIGLWVAIIFAPLAFITYLVPSMRTIEGFGWKNWWNNLAKTAFAAPIYFFFLLLIAKLGQSSFIDTSKLLQEGSGVIILGIVLSFAVMITLLLKATKYAKEAAGEIGGMVTKGLGVVGGFALGAVTGGAAVIGAQTLGRAGNTISNNQKLQDAAAKGGVLGRLARGTLGVSKSAATGSFDLRQTKAGNFASKNTGMDFRSFGPLSSQARAGGYNGAIARKAEKQRKYGENLGYNKNKQAAIDSRIKERESEIDRKVQALEIAKATDGPKSALVAALTEQLGVLKNGLTDAQKTATWTKADVSKGAIKGDGTKVTASDVGTAKFSSTWSQADVLAKKTKADGSLVEAKDVGKTNTDHLGLKELNKISEGNKKNRMNEYFKMQARRAGKDFNDIKQDEVGNIVSLGQLGARKWKNSLNFGDQGAQFGKKLGDKVSGVFGARAGDIGEKLGKNAGLAFSGILKEMRDSFHGKQFNSEVIKASSNLNESIQQFNSTYKAPSSGFLDSMRSAHRTQNSKPAGGAPKPAAAHH